jgi:hypothetical protein
MLCFAATVITATVIIGRTKSVVEEVLRNRIRRDLLQDEQEVPLAERNGGSHELCFDADPTSSGTARQIHRLCSPPRLGMRPSQQAPTRARRSSCKNHSGQINRHHGMSIVLPRS